MANDSEPAVATLRTVLIPILITLALSALRLYGERHDWSPALFSKAPGGGASPIGIVWLIPIFGVLFALKLAKAGLAPERRGKTIGLMFLTLLVLPAAGGLGFALKLSFQPQVVVFAAASLLVAWLAYRVWPALGRLLLAYAIGARIPVILINRQAIMGNWHTHYDAVPKNVPEMNPTQKFLWDGLLPQVTVWIGFTMVLGGLAGAIAIALARRAATAGEAAAAK